MLFALCTQAAAAGTEPETEPVVELPILLPASDSYYPTPWYVKEDSEKTYNLAGLTISGVTRLLTAHFSVFASPIKDVVLRQVINRTLDAGADYLDENGYFSGAWAVTICFYQQYRVTTPALPMTIEYKEHYQLYWGTGGNPKQTLLYEREEEYTDYVYTRTVPEE